MRFECKDCDASARPVNRQLVNKEGVTVVGPTGWRCPKCKRLLDDSFEVSEITGHVWETVIIGSYPSYKEATLKAIREREG